MYLLRTKNTHRHVKMFCFIGPVGAAAHSVWVWKQLFKRPLYLQAVVQALLIQMSAPGTKDVI